MMHSSVTAHTDELATFLREGTPAQTGYHTAPQTESVLKQVAELQSQVVQLIWQNPNTKVWNIVSEAAAGKLSPLQFAERALELANAALGSSLVAETVGDIRLSLADLAQKVQTAKRVTWRDERSDRFAGYCNVYAPVRDELRP